jgi:AAA15 family ATPase/GTPase
MIKKLEIINFKSIKQLSLDCNRINIFIGKPNTGKSNIMESLGMFSYSARWLNSGLKDFVRYERMSNLFHDENLEEPVIIQADNINLKMTFNQGGFEADIREAGDQLTRLDGNYENLSSQGGSPEPLRTFKSYKFSIRNDFPVQEAEFLLPPSGANLMALMLAHKNLRSLANDIFANFGFRLGIRPQENKIEVIKQLDDIIVSYPYSLTSDTLQRIIFHLLAVLSNRDSVITFEEPQSHAFPYYTKFLAEKLALDTHNNQYFISTHNPYFLLPVLKKAPSGDVAIFLTYFQDYQTKVKALGADDIAKVMEMEADVFFNIDSLLGAE